VSQRWVGTGQGDLNGGETDKTGDAKDPHTVARTVSMTRSNSPTTWAAASPVPLAHAKTRIRRLRIKEIKTTQTLPGLTANMCQACRGEVWLAGQLWDDLYMDCLATEFQSPVLARVFAADQD
jgi:hypothetical protein